MCRLVHPKVRLSLGLTKTGKRQGAAEPATTHLEDICRRLWQWKAVAKGVAKLISSPPPTWRKFFNQVLQALSFHRFDFRPYPLRRGGATHFFTRHGGFDQLLVLGRWQSVKTARVYINQGVAVLAEISVPWNNFSRNFHTQYMRSLTQRLPKLELTPKAQKGGRWKKQKKTARKVC